MWQNGCSCAYQHSIWTWGELNFLSPVKDIIWKGEVKWGRLYISALPGIVKGWPDSDFPPPFSILFHWKKVLQYMTKIMILGLQPLIWFITYSLLISFWSLNYLELLSVSQYSCKQSTNMVYQQFIIYKFLASKLSWTQIYLHGFLNCLLIPFMDTYLLQTWGKWEPSTYSIWEEPGYLATTLAGART